MATKKSSYTYPIFTVRWLAVHALAVPTVFFFRVNYSHAVYSALKVCEYTKNNRVSKY